MELFATTGFRRSPLRFTATVVPFWYHRGENLPRLRTAGEARRAACLRLELVVESVRLRVHPADRQRPHFADLRRRRQASDPPEPPHLSLPVKGSSCLRLGAPDPVSETIRALTRTAVERPRSFFGEARTFITCRFVSGFGRRPRQWFQRRPSTSPRSANRTLRSNRRSKTRHARTRLCHRTHPLVHPYSFVLAPRSDT